MFFKTRKSIKNINNILETETIFAEHKKACDKLCCTADRISDEWRTKLHIKKL